MKHHNFEMNNKLYKKTPDKITREDVEMLNDVKRSMNKKFSDSNKYNIGDIVKV